MREGKMQTARGLSAREVEESRRRHGANVFTLAPKKSFGRVFCGNLGDPVIKVLLLALGIHLLMLFRNADWFETVGIAVSVFLATFISTLSEYGSEAAFARLCDELSAHWLGEQELRGTTVRKFEYFVLNCGIYGSEENRILISKKNKGGTLGYVWRRLFLPYETLVMLFPILKKHKWLMPFCQVARWFKLRSREMAKKAIWEVKISSATTRRDVEKMQAFLTEIGL